MIEESVEFVKWPMKGRVSGRGEIAEERLTSGKSAARRKGNEAHAFKAACAVAMQKRDDVIAPVEIDVGHPRDLGLSREKCVPHR